MKKSILTIAAVTLVSIFGAQQAVAKSHTKTVSAHKKHHHKKHTMKSAAISPAAPTSAWVMS